MYRQLVLTPASHRNSQLPLVTCLKTYVFTYASSYGTLLTTHYFGHVQPLSISNQHRDQFLFSPMDHQPSYHFPNWQGPFKIFLITTTLAKLVGFPYWIHLSHIKPFIPPPQLIFLHIQKIQKNPVLLSCGGHRDKLPCFQIWKNKFSSNKHTLPDWEPHMFSFLSSWRYEFFCFY